MSRVEELRREGKALYLQGAAVGVPSMIAFLYFGDTFRPTPPRDDISILLLSLAGISFLGMLAGLALISRGALIYEKLHRNKEQDDNEAIQSEFRESRLSHSSASKPVDMTDPDFLTSNKHLAPKAFISYSRDSDQHCSWVLDLGRRLRGDGIDLSLDEWHLHPGDSLPTFMETMIRETDFVLMVCTPRYKEKSDSRTGGVGYESRIITAELFTKQNQRKFVPILRGGPWPEVAPSSLSDKFYIDLQGSQYSEKEYARLLATLHSRLPQPPPIGTFPEQQTTERPSPKPATDLPSSSESHDGGHESTASNRRAVTHRKKVGVLWSHRADIDVAAEVIEFDGTLIASTTRNDGRIVDDLELYRLQTGRYLVYNSANHHGDYGQAWLSGATQFDETDRPLTLSELQDRFPDLATAAGLPRVRQLE